MLQKWWFKLFIWFSAAAFFYIASSIVIAAFNPEPSEAKIMNYMSGMMNAMHGSTMGYSMTIAEDSFLKNIIAVSEGITIPIMAIGALFGILIKLRRHNDK